MRICHVLWGLTVGGIETMVVNIANDHSAAGNEVHMVAVNDLVDASIVDRLSPAVKLHLIGRKVGGHSVLPVIRLNTVLARINADIVHFHQPNIPRLVFKGILHNWCVTLHCLYRPDEHDAIDFNSFPKLFVISGEVGKTVLEHTGVKGTTVYNGILTDSFCCKKSAHTPGTKMKIVQVGRILFDTKGQDLLFEAAAKLLAAGANIEVDFIGTGPDYDRLQAMVTDSGYGNRLHLAGAKPQEWLYEHMKDYDLLVQPSRSEGFGLTIAEAMASGVPVLVSDINAQQEVIAHGKAGYAFHSADSDSLAEAIAALIDTDMSTTAMNGKERVESHFNLHVTAKGYLSEYKKLTS